MKKYLLIDTYNLFFRASYSIRESDIELCKGMLLHLMFNMINKTCKKFKPDCLIACRDGNKSWRKEEYPAYKMNRVEKLQERTPSEIERDTALKEVFENEFLPFLSMKTNIPVLSYPMAEADDLVATFIKLHPNNVCIILSTDNDFVQLLNNNVFIYNSMEERIISNKGIIDGVSYKPLLFELKNGIVSVPKEQPKEVTQMTPFNDWIEYALFTKCIRGDKSDNIFSAYPGVREKSTKKSIGMMDAFLDRNERGYNWTTFMNSSWDDAFGNKHIVKEEYEKNKRLIDLKNIKADVEEQLLKYIPEVLKKEQVKFVGMNLDKFFNKWNLVNLKRDETSFSTYYQQGYNGNT